MHPSLKTLPSRWLSLAVLAASSLIAPAQAQGLLQAMQGQRAQPVIGATADTAHVHAELLADAPAGIKAGTTFELGLWLDHKAGWHSYWKNPGDTGLPTELKWNLPAGFTAGDIAWPAPEKKTIGSLANYGYEGQILLTVPVTVDAGYQATASTLPVELSATWLVCAKECIPEQASFRLDVPVDGYSPTAKLFAQAHERVPQTVSGKASAKVQDGSLMVSVTGLPVAVRGQQLQPFVEQSGITSTADPLSQSWNADTWEARLPLAEDAASPGQTLGLVLTNGKQSWSVQANVTVAAGAPTAASTVNEPTPHIGVILVSIFAIVFAAVMLPFIPADVPNVVAHILGRKEISKSARLRYWISLGASAIAVALISLGLDIAGPGIGWSTRMTDPLGIAILAGLISFIFLYCKDQAEPCTME